MAYVHREADLVLMWAQTHKYKSEYLFHILTNLQNKIMSSDKVTAQLPIPHVFACDECQEAIFSAGRKAVMIMRRLFTLLIFSVMYLAVMCYSQPLIQVLNCVDMEAVEEIVDRAHEVFQH